MASARPTREREERRPRRGCRWRPNLRFFSGLAAKLIAMFHLRWLVSRLANPLPLGPLALDEPSPIAGPTGSLNRERGMIGWISVALSHDLCAAERAAHRNQPVTL